MSSTRNTGLGVMTTLRQVVQNLDAQRDQLTAAINRDYPEPTHPDDNPEPDSHRERREQLHRDIYPFYLELARAREHLVDAHNLLRDVVDPIDMLREVRQ